MQRRSFIKNTIVAGAGSGLIGTGFALMPTGVKASNQVAVNGNYDLVAIKGEDIVVMYQKAMAEMGGMGKFVKSGQTVVVKPNIGWDVSPEKAANTNPLLVGAIVKQCIEAGASRVHVFDHTCDNWQKSYANSGIEAEVKKNGGKMIPGNFKRNYRPVKIEKAIKLKETTIHEQILESDVFINVPVLKHHSSTSLTIAMKNLMGIVYDRGYWHRNDLHQCIADFCLYKKPDLNIVDAMLVMTQNGPRGRSESDLVKKNSLLISEDIVAVDVASALTFGQKVDNVGYLKAAEKMNIGNTDLSGLNIQRIYQ